MKLVIEKFRCYKDPCSFDLRSKNICITGESGAGKTTLFCALFYCLYGNIRGSSEYNVELEAENIKIKRSKNSLEVRTEDKYDFRGEEAQSKIVEYFGRLVNPLESFLHMQSRDQLEYMETILFDINLGKLKENFTFHKRELDKTYKTLESHERLTRDFLQKIGTIEPLLEEDVDISDVEEKLSFLKNRIYIYDLYCQRVSELTARIFEIEKGTSSGEIPYSYEQLNRHIAAQEQLKRLNWKEYMNYSVEECDIYVEEYTRDKDALYASKCPRCSTELNNIDELLDELGVDTFEEGISEVNKQITLFKEYKSIRAQIDFAQKDILPISNAHQLYKQKQNNEAVSELHYQLEKIKDSAREYDVDSWKEDKKLYEQLKEKKDNVEYYEMKKKEYKIAREYKDKLNELCAQKASYSKDIQGLIDASKILLQTEHQYIRNTLEDFSNEVNTYLSRLNMNVKITISLESLVNGTKKFKIYYDNGYTFDMFSSGEQQRLNIAFTIALSNLQQSSMLLLDEPFSHLDEKNRLNVFELIGCFKGQLLVINHEPIVNFYNIHLNK